MQVSLWARVAIIELAAFIAHRTDTMNAQQPDWFSALKKSFVKAEGDQKTTDMSTVGMLASAAGILLQLFSAVQAVEAER